MSLGVSDLWRGAGVAGVGIVFFACGAMAWRVLSAPPPGRRAAVACLSHIKQIALGDIMYSADNDDRLPPATTWMDAISPRVPSEALFHCPALEGKNEYGYAMNFELSGKDTKALPRLESQVLVFDSVLLARNACSGVYGFPDASRHNGKYNVAFVDGHAKGFTCGRQPGGNSSSWHGSFAKGPEEAARHVPSMERGR